MVKLICLIAALVLFGLAAVGVAHSRFSLSNAGLAALTLSFLVP